MAYLSPKEAAVRLGVNKETVLRRIKAGVIPAVKISARTIRIDENDLKPENLPSAREA